MALLHLPARSFRRIEFRDLLWRLAAEAPLGRGSVALHRANLERIRDGGRSPAPRHARACGGRHQSLHVWAQRYRCALRRARCARSESENAAARGPPATRARLDIAAPAPFAAPRNRRPAFVAAIAGAVDTAFVGRCRVARRIWLAPPSPSPSSRWYPKPSTSWDRRRRRLSPRRRRRRGAGRFRSRWRASPPRAVVMALALGTCIALGLLAGGGPLLSRLGLAAGSPMRAPAQRYLRCARRRRRR